MFENPASKYQGGKTPEKNLSAEDLENAKTSKMKRNGLLVGATLLATGAAAPAAYEKAANAIKGDFSDKNIVMTEGQRSEMATASIQKIIKDFKEKATKADQNNPEVTSVIEKFEESEEAFKNVLKQKDATLKVHELNKLESEMAAEQLELLRKSL